MRSRIFLALAVLAFPASAALARPGCSYGNGSLGSQRFSNGINAVAPGRAVQNPCSSMYGFGKNLRRMEKRQYPGAIVHH